jgi:hypothetical protein
MNKSSRIRGSLNNATKYALSNSDSYKKLITAGTPNSIVIPIPSAKEEGGKPSLRYSIRYEGLSQSPN